MKKRELENFHNDGFGWKCKKCELELKIEQGKLIEERSRLMQEGEAESKSPELSNLALAKWTDENQDTLICLRCGITEDINS